MYKDFYQLTARPFENTPDPEFLYLSRQHREILSSLLYGIKSSKGFILITGDVGTGKTTLIRSLLKQIDSSYTVIHVINPRSTFNDFLDHLTKRLNLVIEYKNRFDILEELRKRLEALLQENRRLVILVDEAHLLSEESLEEIRLLSNIENEKTKLVQIVLVGQNEIYHLLNRDSQKSLKQRIVINRQLSPLNKRETREYIKHRLTVAGGDTNLFNRAALRLILKFSKGIPRLINQICDNALLIGYATDKQSIGPSIIQEVMSDMGQLYEKSPKYIFSFPHFAWVSLVLVSILISLTILTKTTRFPVEANFSLPEWTKMKPEEQGILHDEKQTEGSSAIQTDTPPSHFPGSPAFQPQLSVLPPDQIELSQEGIQQSRDDKETPAIASVSAQSQPAYQETVVAPDQQDLTEQETLGIATRRKELTRNQLKVLPKTLQDNPLEEQEIDRHTIHRNEWLTVLARNEYNCTSETLLDLIHMANESEIKNIHKVYLGQEIILPIITKESMVVSGEDNTFYIHYASFYRIEPARKAHQDLLSRGTEAFIIPARQGEHMVFRVYIGLFNDRETARMAAINLDFRQLPFLKKTR